MKLRSPCNPTSSETLSTQTKGLLEDLWVTRHEDSFSSPPEENQGRRACFYKDRCGVMGKLLEMTVMLETSGTAFYVPCITLFHHHRLCDDFTDEGPEA